MKDLPPSGGNGLRDIIQAIRELIRGRNNAVTTITLTANATTTTFTGPNVNENAQPLLSPLTAAAAAAVATSPGVYASISRVAGVNTVTITHANDPSTTRTFALAILGG